MEIGVAVIIDELADLDPVLSTPTETPLPCNRVRLLSACGDEPLGGAACVVSPDDVIAHAERLAGAIVITPGFSAIDASLQAGLTVVSLRGWAGDTPRVFARLQRSFERLAAWDLELVRAVANRIPLSGVARIAAQELHNPFALMDEALRPILIGGTLPDNVEGTIWEQVIGVDYTPNETFGLPPEELCFFEGRGREPYYADISRYPDHHNLIANVFMGGQTIATLNTTSDVPYPITKGQQFLFCRVRDAFEQAMGADRGETEQDPALVYHIIALIEGRRVDASVAEDRLSEHGWRPRTPYHVTVATGPSNASLEEARARFCLIRIRAHCPTAITLQRDGSILILSQITENQAESIERIIETLGLAAGRSMPFTSMSALRQAYGQAVVAARLSALDQGTPRLHEFGRECFDAIASEADALGCKGLSLCHSSLLELIARNQKNADELLECIQGYLANGCNLAKAAAVLNMHRNTLAYRIERAESLLGMKLDAMEESERMHLWLSCRIARRR